METAASYTRGMEYLVDVVQKLSLARTLQEVIDITRRAARELTGADGAAFVLRDEDRCYYVDEDAIGPLWKGSKFPMSSCISGWSMMNRKSVAIEDVFSDPRIPVDAYRVTFVKSLLVVPIRVDRPIGAIGNYWAREHSATPEQVRLLEALASSTSIALENINLYKELKEANSYLAESLQARDEFFQIAAHELRTPMSAIMLELQMAERKLQKLLAQENPLKRSIEQVKKLTTEIETLFDVNQITSGNLTLNQNLSDVSAVADEEIGRLKSEFERVGCKLQCSLEPGLLVECDAGKFRIILRNLFVNVIRHASACDMTFTLKSHQGELHLTVEDSGTGISSELRERLLKSFERGHTPRRLGGLGLGLFIVKSYAEAHEGSLTIDSDRSSGTKITVILPLKKIAILA